MTLTAAINPMVHLNLTSTPSRSDGVLVAGADEIVGNSLPNKPLRANQRNTSYGINGHLPFQSCMITRVFTLVRLSLVKL